MHSCRGTVLPDQHCLMYDLLMKKLKHLANQKERIAYFQLFAGFLHKSKIKIIMVLFVNILVSANYKSSANLVHPREGGDLCSILTLDRQTLSEMQTM